MTNEEMDANKEMIKLRDKTLKLVQSELWKEIIEVEYFEHEAVRLVNTMGNLQLTNDHKKNLIGMMAGIPGLNLFIGRLIGDGNQAEMDIEQYESDL